jgi:putative aldouronate transport system substrate-binding protein
MTISRRAFVARLGGSALATALLAACSAPATSTAPTSAPAAPAGQPTTPPAAAAPTSTAKPTTAPAQAAPAATQPPAVVSRSGRLQLPTYMAPKGAPPDVPGTKVVPGGYLQYPKQLIKSVPETPGRGGEITITTQTLTVSPVPMDQNRYWQEANTRLGVKLNFSITPFADYGAKVATIMAGSDLPDIMYLPQGQPVPGFPQFLESRAADLTPYLSGDAVKDYPNLAAHPTSVWKSTVINNKIFGVGTPLAPFFWVHWMHQELLEQLGLEPPKTAADYKRVMQAVTKPNEGMYGLVAEAGYQYGYGTINQLLTSIYGGPNQWSLEDGKLTRLFETEQFKSAVEFARDVWASGLYEPGAGGYNTLSARTAFIARKGMFRWDGNTPDHFIARGAPQGQQPPPKIRLVPPFGAESGATPSYPLYHGNFGTAVLKKAPDDKIKELLRIINWMAAPFGTEEYHFRAYGLEGVHFDYNDRGSPVINETQRAEVLPWNGVTNPPPVYFDPNGTTDYVPHVIDTFKLYETVGKEDPTVGFYSESAGRVGVLANQRFGDGISDIITGRRETSDFAGLLQQWKAEGGDQVRKEYEDAMAASG